METLARLRVICDEQRLAEPVTVRKGAPTSKETNRKIIRPSEVG
jgi:hypothetical protein